eukprot:TRINITY_DN1778_c1_g3_i2.p1 TRINITY_DN1778_c1_g3~~TRINITY_DN1778_c1_g3_i2.p1  ORF type:complete len:723 (+),score=138.09 TRINITY_DN1778_c1_g3_i2:67-2235(+)
MSHLLRFLRLLSLAAVTAVLLTVVAVTGLAVLRTVDPSADFEDHIAEALRSSRAAAWNAVRTAVRVIRRGRHQSGSASDGSMEESCLHGGNPIECGGVGVGSPQACRQAGCCWVDDACVTSEESLSLRWNFAGEAYGARTVDVTEGTQGGRNSILLGDKDRYLTFPTYKPRKFVTVRLSAAASLHVVVLGNYEYYSSTAKHFWVLGSGTYPCHKEQGCQWSVLGNFTASPQRGLQVFALSARRMFVEYVRILFVSHHGTEPKFTLTALRLYGDDLLIDMAKELEAGEQQPGDAEAEPDNGPTPADLPTGMRSPVLPGGAPTVTPAAVPEPAPLTTETPTVCYTVHLPPVGTPGAADALQIPAHPRSEEPRAPAAARPRAPRDAPAPAPQPPRTPTAPPPCPPAPPLPLQRVCPAGLPPWMTPRGRLRPGRVCVGPSRFSPFLAVSLPPPQADPDRPMIAHAGSVFFTSGRKPPSANRTTAAPPAQRNTTTNVSTVLATNKTGSVGGGQNVLVLQYSRLKGQYDDLKSRMEVFVANVSSARASTEHTLAERLENLTSQIEILNERMEWMEVFSTAGCGVFIVVSAVLFFVALRGRGEVGSCDAVDETCSQATELTAASRVSSRALPLELQRQRHRKSPGRSDGISDWFDHQLARSVGSIDSFKTPLGDRSSMDPQSPDRASQMEDAAIDSLGPLLHEPLPEPRPRTRRRRADRRRTSQHSIST